MGEYRENGQRDEGPDTFDRLRAPFADNDVTTARLNGGTYKFVDARVLRARLSGVLGRGNWQTRLTPAHGHGCVCHLRIEVAGEPIERGAMGWALVLDDGTVRAPDDVAFEHACELFGVAEYLAIADDGRYAPPATTRPARSAEPARDERPSPRDDDRRERTDERPARDDSRDRDAGLQRTVDHYQEQRDRRQERNGGGRDRGGARREYGDHGSRGPRNGSGWGNGPRPGGSAHAWLCEIEETHPKGRGVKKHVEKYMQSRGWGWKVSALSQDELWEIVDVVKDYIGETADVGR